MPHDNDSKDRYNAYKKLYIVWSVGIQIVVSLLVGFGMGLALDRWLGTAPWLMLLFIGLGVAAGFLNVYKTLVKDELENSK